MKKNNVLRVLLATGLISGSAVALASTETIDFNEMFYGSYAGVSNTGVGACPGTGDQGCYEEAGMVFGHPAASNGGHVHSIVNDYDPINDVNLFTLEYHNDSSGIYFRRQDGGAFSLDSMSFDARIQNGNRLSNTVPSTSQNYWATPYWEILRFNTAVNPDISFGDGTDYSTRVAYSTVANGFNGTLTQGGNLSADFSNVNAVWIHFAGFPTTPTNGKTFTMLLDDVVVTSAVPVPAAVWLFGSGLLGLLSFGRKQRG